MARESAAQLRNGALEVLQQPDENRKSNLQINSYLWAMQDVCSNIVQKSFLHSYNCLNKGLKCINDAKLKNFFMSKLLSWLAFKTTYLRLMPSGLF